MIAFFIRLVASTRYHIYIIEDDVIVIAGKGHENYQIIGDKTLHFSDQEVAEAYLTKK